MQQYRLHPAQMKGPFAADGEIAGAPLMNPNPVQRADCRHQFARNGLDRDIKILLWITGGYLAPQQLFLIKFIAGSLLEPPSWSDLPQAAF